MSLKKIEQVKIGKWFKIWDLLVYGLLAGGIVALILVFAFAGKGGELDGVSVSYKGERILNYSFTDNKLDIIKSEYIEVNGEDEDSISLTFYTEDKKGYNEIEINKAEKSVKVTASNCSTHKDCVYSSPVKGTRSVPILCTPHALAISPLKIYDDGIIIT